MKHLGLLVLLAGCSGANGGTTGDTDPPPYPMDEVLRLNHVQAKGTHNSYHVEPAEARDPSFRYTHESLDVQLSEQGVRQFELDLHLRQDGGFEVFHIPLLDEETTCRKLVDCLGVVKDWSDQNPLHMPIMIWLEPKDEDADFLDDTLVPIFGHYDELEAEILSVWPKERILTPDDVRKDYATLPEAIAAEGWPTLGALRGRVIFSMLDSENHREAYTRDAPALEGRLLFVDADQASDSYAALFKINNAQSDGEQVQSLVAAGFIVTSNVDGVTQDDAANAARSEASLEAGVHYSSSDFPAPVSSRDYWFDIPDGNPAQCNPVYGSDPCMPKDIENLP
jgi:glycerophosphoryl diester phosphodiesterase